MGHVFNRDPSPAIDVNDLLTYANELSSLELWLTDSNERDAGKARHGAYRTANDFLECGKESRREVTVGRLIGSLGRKEVLGSTWIEDVYRN